MSKRESTKEAVFLWHEELAKECDAIGSAGAVIHPVSEHFDKRIVVAPPELRTYAFAMVDRLGAYSARECARFQKDTWRPLTPPVLIDDVNSATLWKNQAWSVVKISVEERELFVNEVTTFINVALTQWSHLEIEHAGLRETLSQLHRYHSAEDLYKLRPSGTSFRLHAVMSGFEQARTENLNQLVVLVGQTGVFELQQGNSRKRRPAKVRVPRISFCGGSVILDGKEHSLPRITLY
ncbi:hypothetical protein [Pseudomonas hunanensis]|uniref:hypothetical protein n=1 Tax=Pseudomonas hunanensis TaxID=1247546 RepID=UPI0030DBFC05